MDLKVEFLAGGDHRARGEVESVIFQAIGAHPFFCRQVRPPESLVVNVRIDMAIQTSIEHHLFCESGAVMLNLNELQLFKTRDDGAFICLDSDPLNEQLVNVVAHEFGHLIDARLDPAFGFSDALQPADDVLRRRFYNLWDSYIDGRLGMLAPYTLAERQEESWKAGRVAPEVIESAWRGAFRTHGDLLRVAGKLRPNGDS